MQILSHNRGLLGRLYSGWKLHAINVNSVCVLPVGWWEWRFSDVFATKFEHLSRYRAGIHYILLYLCARRTTFCLHSSRSLPCSKFGPFGRIRVLVIGALRPYRGRRLSLVYGLPAVLFVLFFPVHHLENPSFRRRQASCRGAIL